LSCNVDCANPSFARQVVVDGTPGKAPWALDVRDVNQDGFVDIAVAFAVTVELRINDGIGGFPTSTVVTSDPSATFRSVHVADVNSDGSDDVIVVNSNTLHGYVRVFFGPSFASFVTVASDLKAPIGSVVADFDGDGQVDIAVAVRDDNVVRVYGNTAGGSSFVVLDTFGVASGRPIGVHGADLDGDSDVDLIVAYRGIGSVRVYANSGSGSFSETVVDNSTPEVRSVFAADVTGDGRPDILAAVRDSNEIAVFSRVGSGLTTWSRSSVATLASPVWVEAADINGDGYIDVLAASDPVASNGEFVWLQNIANNGSFSAHTLRTGVNDG